MKWRRVGIAFPEPPSEFSAASIPSRQTVAILSNVGLSIANIDSGEIDHAGESWRDAVHDYDTTAQRLVHAGCHYAMLGCESVHAMRVSLRGEVVSLNVEAGTVVISDVDGGPEHIEYVDEIEPDDWSCVSFAEDGDSVVAVTRSAFVVLRRT